MTRMRMPALWRHAEKRAQQHPGGVGCNLFSRRARLALPGAPRSRRAGPRGTEWSEKWTEPGRLNRF